jgi:hypothetical protein
MPLVDSSLVAPELKVQLYTQRLMPQPATAATGKPMFPPDLILADDPSACDTSLLPSNK